MNNTDHSIQRVTWLEKQQELRAIRDEVFLQEQQVPVADEWDGKDEDAIHFLVVFQHHSIATARVLIETDPNHETSFHIGRVAVRKPFRNSGVGHRLMRAVIEWCLEQNSSARVYLHAQTTRQHFYENLGFITEGQEFIDAGIPHISMWYQPLNKQ